jgi:hypothetical protein
MEILAIQASKSCQFNVFRRQLGRREVSWRAQHIFIETPLCGIGKTFGPRD